MGVSITGGHHLPSMIANLPQGYQIELVNPQNLLLGFKKSKVRVFVPAVNDWRMKSGASTLLPDFWTAKRIKEECAFALFKAGNPLSVDPFTNRLNFISYLSNGTRVEIIIYKNSAGVININNILFFQY